MRSITLLTAFLGFMVCHAQFNIVFESSNGKRSAPYAEVIDFYQRLDLQYSSVKMEEIGPTDTDYPLHVVYYSADGKFDIKNWKQDRKLIILINNGIHPGEPDGIDASMMLLRDAARGKLNIPHHVVLAVIPVFNIGGSLNRGSYSRANQNGPQEYGFRGSAQNLDLNRDFMKMDAKETQTLVQLFHQLDPDIFVDNHVSNGADYQHVMTLLSAQPDKLGKHMGPYLSQVFEPWLYQNMKSKGYDLVPYVHVFSSTPDKGWQQFYDPPRFASGWAGLFQTFAFVPETHMLKPFKQRVKSTYALMQSFIEFADTHSESLRKAREAEKKFIQETEEFTLDWNCDTTKPVLIPFKGYEAKYKTSKVTGKQRLYYDRRKAYEKLVPFYNKFKPVSRVVAPKYYVIPQGWVRVIERLKWNGVEMQKLKRDTTISLNVYRIIRYETTPRPYEGHYLHRNLEYSITREDVKLLKGDYLIPVHQPAKRYIAEALEPDAPDAFFSWGFFDAILQQKEYFSDYVFEDEAERLLKKDKSLKRLFEDKKRTDAAFTNDADAQLDFIYRHSPYYEPEYLRYPVFRID